MVTSKANFHSHPIHYIINKTSQMRVGASPLFYYLPTLFTHLLQSLPYLSNFLQHIPYPSFLSSLHSR